MTIPNVSMDWNETELSHFWFDKILEKANWQAWPENRNSFRRYESRVHAGRLDVSLYVDTRPIACIELKRPRIRISDNPILHLEQAWKYAHSMSIWRKGCKISPFGVLTNGTQCIVFDGSLPLDDAIRTAHDMTLPGEIGNLIKIIDRQKAEEEKCIRHFVIECPIRNDKKAIADSADKRFSTELKNIYSDLSTSMSKQDAFHTTITLFLAAVLRDCGFFPPTELNELENNEDWLGLIACLEEILHTNLEIFKTQSNAIGWKQYNKTRHFPVRLDIFPADCLGKAYEDLLHSIEPQKSTTSYYTPGEIIDELLIELQIHPSQKILDPTCGSAAFLSNAVNLLFPPNSPKEHIRTYIEKCIFGVDKDWYACQIARAALIATYAKLLPYDPIFDAPKTNIIKNDFFSFPTTNKFDVIVGNAPWGPIDGKNSNIVEKKHRISFSKFPVYLKNSDISIFVLQKSMHHLNPNGKIALLFKQQVLESKYRKEFLKWASNNLSSIWDYGHIELFDNPASLTAIAFKTSNNGFQLIRKYTRQQLNIDNMIPLVDLFHICRGFQSQADDTYKHIAQRLPDFQCNRLLAPTSNEIQHFSINRQALRKIAFIDRSPTDEIITSLNEEEKTILSNRPQAGISTRYSWIGRDSIEHYIFNNNQKRIFTSRILNGDRLRASIDDEGDVIGITSHTILIPNPTTDDNKIFAVLAWLNSRFFRIHLLEMNCKKMANGGIATYPEQLMDCSIPQILLENDEIIDISRNYARLVHGPTPQQLDSLDEKIEVIITPSIRAAS